MVPLTRLTSIYGSFRAHVVAARLCSEGFDVELRGAVDSPYAVTMGELARVDLYVPTDQVQEACVVLLADEVEDALDDEPVRRVLHPGWWLVAAGLLVMVASPVLFIVRGS